MFCSKSIFKSQHRCFWLLVLDANIYWFSPKIRIALEVLISIDIRKILSWGDLVINIDYLNFFLKTWDLKNIQMYTTAIKNTCFPDFFIHIGIFVMRLLSTLLWNYL